MAGNPTDLSPQRHAGGAGFDLLPGDEPITIPRSEKNEVDEVRRLDLVLRFFEELRQKLRAEVAKTDVACTLR